MALVGSKRESGKFVRGLLIAMVGLTVISLVLQYLLLVHHIDSLAWLARQFHTADEWNIPTFFSVGLWLTAAILLVRLAMRPEQRQLRWRWGSLAVLCGYFMFDELLGIHERLDAPLRETLGFTGGLYFHTWVITGVLLWVTIGLVYLDFVLGLAKPVQRRLIAGAVVFLLGAVGFEMFAAVFEGQLRFTFYHELLRFPEEMFEMLGVIIFIDGLLLVEQTNPKINQTNS